MATTVITRCDGYDKAVDIRIEHISDVTHFAAVSFSLRQPNVAAKKYSLLHLAADTILRLAQRYDEGV
jgi:hypothetical protein